MKILQINNNHYKAGGADSVYLNTIELLRDNGHQVISLSRFGSQINIKNKDEYFIPYSSALFNRFYSVDARKEIERIICIEKPDIVHLHCIIGGITFSVLPIITKHHIPTVMTVHDFRLQCPVAIYMDSGGNICEKCEGGKYYHCMANNCSPEGLFRSINLVIESYFRDTFIPYSDYINKFIFVSDFAKDKFLEPNHKLSGKSYRIYNFTNIFKRSRIRGKYFLYFGRLTREKGLNTLIEAFRVLPHLKLKIVGDGTLREKLLEDIPLNVEVMGFRKGNELEEIIQNSFFTIIPSECYETLSLSAVESFAMGKPVIGSKIGALTELIENGKRGYTFTQRNAMELKEILLKCEKLSDEDYNSMSVDAFNFSLKFNKNDHYDKLLSVYNEAIAETSVQRI